MMTLSIRYIALILMSLLLGGCFNQKAYERLENSYLPQPMSMSSKVKLVCNNDNHYIFEPGSFQFIYGFIASIDSPYSLSSCVPFKSNAVIKETNKLSIASNSQPEYNLVEIGDQWSRKFIPNLDPEKGAVYIWETYVGAQRLDGVISYNLVIYEGKKMPLGGMLLGWSSETGSVYEGEKLMIHDRQWEYFSKRSMLIQDEKLWGFQSKAGDIAQVVDYYRTQVGNYTVLIFGIFPQPVTHFPEWLNPRRALLREWVETFKITPLPVGYILPSKEEIQQLREKEIRVWKEREANLPPTPVNPAKAREALSAPVRGW